MAVNKVPAASILRLELRVGVSASGNPVIRNKNLANVKSTASDQDLYDIAAALAALQQYPLNGISRVDNAQLVQA
ncbi:MAG: hypothetical protein A4E52_01359 [Pelotomaculum sp. PtaB.Bin013]|nr:MAG: hypothetical protein A4E52_01359 [Pelotomaculum sp. PtaB.Bin013]